MDFVHKFLNISKCLHLKLSPGSAAQSNPVTLCLPSPDVLPEMENQPEYEGQNFNFTSPDNLDNGGSQNLTKLTTANMEDMEEYYNFGKDTSSYATP